MLFVGIFLVGLQWGEKKDYLEEIPTVPFEDEELNLKFLYPLSWELETFERNYFWVLTKNVRLTSEYQRKDLSSWIEIEIVPREAEKRIKEIMEYFDNPDYLETIFINDRKFIRSSCSKSSKMCVRSYRETWLTEVDNGVIFIDMMMIYNDDPYFEVVDRIIETIEIQ